MNSRTVPKKFSVLLSGAIIVAAAFGFYTLNQVHGESAENAASAPVTGSSNMITVRVIDKDGKLTGPVQMAKVIMSDEEWKKKLTPQQFAIVRGKGTERAFCGTLLDNHKEGYYVCVGCGLPLFHSHAKFNSRTGWPSFFQPVAKENITEIEDRSLGMVRTEIECARCDGHLGHVFDDGPKPTGLRYCLNSESLRFVDDADAKSLAENVTPAATPKSVLRLPLPAVDTPKASAPSEAKAVFAGGCFWCTEAVFDGIPGVKDVTSGYSGGDPKRATYEEVCKGDTGHAEAIQITYDPSKVTFGELMRVFMGTHNPTQVNAQGPDHGTQYRSAVFFMDAEQKKVAEAYIKQLGEAKKFGDKAIAAALEEFKGFYPAEDYHQDFYRNNPNQPYVRAYIPEKLKKRDELLSEVK